MKISKINIIILLFTSILLFTFCTSKYQQLLKSNHSESKLEAAINYYNKNDFYKALQLLENLQNVVRGTTDAEKVAYYYAYCHYGQGDYYLAAYHFKDFYTTYPKSNKAEECLFMNAYCKYLESPKPTLDQTFTTNAIHEFQVFINRYPLSDSLTACNNYIDQLRKKLETKAYESAIIYYNIENYNSAIIALNNLIKDYPGSDYKEDALYYILKSSHIYALNSIDSKKRERFEAAISAYQELITTYPNSKHLKDATIIYKTALKELEKNTTNKNS